MEQVSPTRHLAGVIEGLPPSPVGMRKKTRAEGMGVPCVLGAVDKHPLNAIFASVLATSQEH